MCEPLLIIHSYVRWITFILLVYSIYRAVSGYLTHRVFSNHVNAIRHWTATIVQIQIMIGLILYFNSPFVTSYWNHSSTESFCPLIHLLLMLTAVIVISVGS